MTRLRCHPSRIPAKPVPCRQCQRLFPSTPADGRLCSTSCRVEWQRAHPGKKVE